MTQACIQTEIPGPLSREIIAAEQRHLSPGLQGFALWAGVAMERGEGSVLIDVDGNRYVDLIGGIGVNSLGHCHPTYVEALVAQVKTLTVGSFTSAPRAALVNEVCELAPAGFAGKLNRLQLYSGGSEAVESALRLARQNRGRTGIASFTGAFHGKTAGAAALMGSDLKDGLGPFPEGGLSLAFADCYRCPFGLQRPTCGLACADHARERLKTAPRPVAAVIAEPMQGTAGNIIPPKEFLPAVAEAAREVDALFIADEMITGFGRTGRPWGVDHSGVRADIVTLGKGFGSGFPVSGVLTRDDLSRTEPWAKPSGASSSYGGNPLAAAAALASVRIIRDERLWENAALVGDAMLAELRRMAERFPFIGDVRGEGLLLGIELVKDRHTKEPVSAAAMRRVYDDCVRRGLLAMSYSPHLRLQPALTIERETALEGLALLGEAFEAMALRGDWR